VLSATGTFQRDLVDSGYTHPPGAAIFSIGSRDWNLVPVLIMVAEFSGALRVVRNESSEYAPNVARPM
jgi:hypothetical protein